MSRPRLLFVFLQRTSFVEDDLTHLSERYDVRTFHFDTSWSSTPVGQLWNLCYFAVKEAIWLLRELPRAEGVFAWFADYHSVLPALLARMLRKPMIVAVGGYDAIHLPAMNYGVYESPWRGSLARLVFHKASLILPVSASLEFSENRFSTWPELTRQGIRTFVPGLRTPVEVVATGYDPSRWPLGPPDRAPIVCTVGRINSARTLRRKGVDLLFEVARRLPNAWFQVIGVGDIGAVRKDYRVPENVELLPPLPRAALPAYYGAAAVYVQLSRAEGLPNVLCEAMLCGCVPVGSSAFGIPDGIGDAGFVVDTPDPDVIAAAVEQALRCGPDARTRARTHIVEHYHWNRRKRALFAAMERVGVRSEAPAQPS